MLETIHNDISRRFIRLAARCGSQRVTGVPKKRWRDAARGRTIVRHIHTSVMECEEFVKKIVNI
jgi:hypothetical protein